MNPLSRPRAGAAWASRLWPAFALAFGLVAIVLPQSDVFRAIPGDLGDARLNGLLLEHVFRWLCGVDPSLWSPDFFHPYPGALSFSDSHLGTVAAYAVLRVAGLGPEMAYIGWFTLACVANFLGCHHALRRFGFSAPGSATGAFLFAFAMPALAQSGHAQLGYRFAVPLAVLALYRLLRDGRPIHLAWLGAWVALQFYCTIYIGYFLLLLLGSYLVALYLVPASASGFLRPHRLVVTLVRAPRDREWWSSVLMLGAGIAALAALFLPYAYYAHLYGFARSPIEIASLLPRPGSYLLADASRLWGAFSLGITGIAYRQEQQMFVGGAACLLALVGLVRATPCVRVSALALLLLVVFTLHAGGYSLYAFVERLPLASAIRAASRIILVLLLPMAVLVAAGVDRLVVADGRHFHARRILAVLLVAALGLECATLGTANVPLVEWRARLDALRAQVPAALPADAIVFVPRQPGVPFHLTELDGMALAQALGRASLNGYSGNSPPGYGQTTDPCDDMVDRLTGYAAFMHRDMASVEALARRVVPIGGPLQCTLPPALPARTVIHGALPLDMFDKVGLAIVDMAVADPRQLTVEIDVHNGADTRLGSLSDTGQSVRFSWRFVAIGDTAPDGIGWEARSELRSDVPAHGQVRQRLRIDVPRTPGRYRLDVSMVQEGVAWFHGRGTALAHGPREIGIGADGRLVGLR